MPRKIECALHARRGKTGTTTFKTVSDKGGANLNYLSDLQFVFLAHGTGHKKIGAIGPTGDYVIWRRKECRRSGGMILSLEIIRNLPPGVRDATVLLDNQSAIAAIRNRECRPGQYLVDVFHREVSSLLRARRSLRLRVVWVPGHTDVHGNEEADAQAKRAAEGDETETSVKAFHKSLPVSAAALRANRQKECTKARANWWLHSPARAKLRRIDPTSGKRAHVDRLYDELPRRQASLLTQLRSGHIGLNGFLARIRVEPSPLCAMCRVPETVTHFLLHCTKYTRARAALRGSVKRRYISLNTLLNQPANLPALFRFIRDTNRFPRYAEDLPSLPSPNPTPR